jgi:hypothetical protein
MLNGSDVVLSGRSRDENGAETTPLPAGNPVMDFIFPWLPFHCRIGYSSSPVMSKPISTANKTSTGAGTGRSADDAVTTGVQPKAASPAPPLTFNLKTRNRRLFPHCPVCRQRSLRGSGNSIAVLPEINGITFNSYQPHLQTMETRGCLGQSFQLRTPQLCKLLEWSR